MWINSSQNPCFWIQYNMFTKIVSEYISLAFRHIFVQEFFPYITYIQFLSRLHIGGKFLVLSIVFQNRDCTFDSIIHLYISFCHFLRCAYGIFTRHYAPPLSTHLWPLFVLHFSSALEYWARCLFTPSLSSCCHRMVCPLLKVTIFIVPEDWSARPKHCG